MPRKKTHDEVKIFIEEQNFALLDKHYKNSKIKLHMKCPEGHDCHISYNGFSRGNRCITCYGNKTKTIEEIRIFIEKEGYQLLSNLYINNKTSLHLTCPQKHDYFTCFRDFNSGYRCSDCKGNKKKSLEQVEAFFRNEGYQLISNEYINAHQELLTICPFSHNYTISYNHFQQGQRCPKCAVQNRKQTCLIKYGVDHPLKNIEIALKNARSSNNFYIRKHWRTSGELVCKGSWEAKVVDYLNTNQINYEWQPKVFDIPENIMLSEKGNSLTYRPDFYLNDQNVWVEIKGWMRPTAQIKWDWFKTVYPTAELWDRKRLKNMGILKN